MIEGGSDTSSSIIIAFIHAMTRWPEVMKKAQTEIDEVVGEDRTPRWEDYDNLPYVAATVKEAMRWRPVVPLAFPHSLTEGRCIFFLLEKVTDCEKMIGWMVCSFLKARQF